MYFTLDAEILLSTLLIFVVDIPTSSIVYVAETFLTFSFS